MKKIFFISLLAFTSCNSNKVLMNYMNQEMERNDSFKIVMYENKISANKTLNTLRGPLSNRITSGLPTSLILSDADFAILFEKYKNDTLTEKWNKSDFKNIDVEIIKSENLSSESNLKNKTIDVLKVKENWMYKNDLIYRGYRFFYMLSKPLFLNENLLVFYFSKSSGWTILSAEVVVMERVNKKWKVVERVETSEIY
ncbi:hypothetical protein ACFPVY_12325 [Flavobacterium qiangtangense]|uniref:Lipoprotein n=1 Tax=Flavobacterium qiangtangense TaxID=1442595 RepID=A0ABW1PRJ7_9FLAO